VNSKEHVIRLAHLEREMRALPDDTLRALITAAPEDTQKWLVGLSGGGEDGTLDVPGLRGAMTRGRMKGVPDKVALVLTETCLQDCITTLGDRADLPDEADLVATTPGLVERHGVPTTRLMFASAILSEAPSSRAIVKVLKNDPALAVG
jgi:hypothetical protein